MLRKKSRMYKKIKLTNSESDFKNYKEAKKVTKKLPEMARKKLMFEYLNRVVMKVEIALTNT